MLRVLALVLIGLLLFAGVPVEAGPVSENKSEDRKPNRLLGAASPYLRQHAYNPIDWYEWGEEAFEKAKKENKPIFLSVGYSTCHWCHVMERESFENEKIASILNASFVAIKVDRERRPDVDETYMLATQLITGGGGWPNSVFLTPERKPFYAGTYFPPDAFRSLLIQVSGFWNRQRDRLIEDADKLSATIEAVMTRRVEAAQITAESLTRAGNALMSSFDPVSGGFGGAPKFPQEPLLLFLLRLAEKDGNKDALQTVVYTLEAMLNGGIHDHVGGGFHRYSVDAGWLVPHFEKMLYNQALISLALVRAYKLTGNERLAAGARRALDYVLADMTDSQGGFYSARDADSEGEEGTFYVWTEQQLDEALGKAEAAFAKKAFGVTFEGNFENGTTVLNYPKSPQQLAKELGVSDSEFETRIAKITTKLEKERAKREHPIRDDKILAAWNGMMITAFSEAAEILDEKRYEQAALKAGEFLWENMQKDGVLARSWFEGSAPLDGQQEDYAFAARSFVALYDLTGDRVWLERAETLAAEMVEQFRDEAAGDYYMTASASTFSRAKARTDAGTPSGNAAALELFALLDRRSVKPEHRVHGEALLAALSGLAMQAPSANAYTLMAADLLMRGGSGPRQHLSKGVVDAHAAYDRKSRELRVTLKLADGWHVNSNAPLEEFFIPTQFKVEGIDDAKISYPKDKKIRLGFHDKDIAVYEGEVTLKAKLPENPEGAILAELKVQACSDKICLDPETASLRVPVH